MLRLNSGEERDGVDLQLAPASWSTDEVMNLEWFDRTVLEQLVSRAQRISIGADKTSHDLTWLR